MTFVCKYISHFRHIFLQHCYESTVFRTEIHLRLLRFVFAIQVQRELCFLLLLLLSFAVVGGFLSIQQVPLMMVHI
jgi:hypothetical protein